jgi:hypothetical protein
MKDKEKQKPAEKRFRAIETKWASSYVDAEFFKVIGNNII